MAGYVLTKKRQGAIAAGLFYAVFSVAFMSAEFHPALAESFSLLPATIAYLFFLTGIRTKRSGYFLLVGIGIGLSALFKTTSGIMGVAVCAVCLTLDYRFIFRCLLSSLLGLMMMVTLPLLLAPDFRQALYDMVFHLTVTKMSYIDAYDAQSFWQWFLRYGIRTFLIIISALLMWILAFQSLARLFTRFGSMTSDRRAMLVMLTVWLVADLWVVTLGRRIFFHYYILLLPSVALLAAYTVAYSFSVRSFQEGWGILWSKRYRIVTSLAVLSLITFMADGVLRFSLRHREVGEAVSFIKRVTGPKDRIYVWGLLPQLYFFSQRQPASVMIWANFLINQSPASPAMEYVNLTGKKLGLLEGILRDLRPSEEYVLGAVPIHSDDLNSIFTHELLFDSELLAAAPFERWREVMSDLYRNPPAIFVDTSPSGIRGFSYHPIEKYDLLRRFIADHYHYLATVNGIIFYELNHTRS